VPIRLIAIDLDGTLLTSQKQIHPRVRDAVLEATLSGTQVILATGRMSTSAIKFAEELDIPGPHICCNGADIVYTNGTFIQHTELDNDQAMTVVNFATRNGIQINVYTKDSVLFLERTAWTDWYLRRVPHLNPQFVDASEVRTVSVSKVLLMDNPERIPTFRSELESSLDLNRVTITESEPQYLEILPKDVSKGHALARIAGDLGFSASEVAAIGDYLNDLEMVEWAGFGGAMLGADDRLKTVAEIVVGSNDDGSVADFIVAARAR
jgi:Cof subfamily protein (haloacid dehalogenase superfamily)